MFCKQKGYLEEELDYRKQALDQAYMVRECLQFTGARFPLLLRYLTHQINKTMY